MTVSGDTHGILGMAGEYGLSDRKWFNHKTTPSMVTCTHVRGPHAALKVSQRLLRGQEVVVLVFEVVQFQVATSVHPQQLVPCGQQSPVQSGHSYTSSPAPPRPTPGCCQATASTVSMR